jgi:hypothetical protein
MSFPWHGPEDEPGEAPLDETTPPMDEQFGEDLGSDIGESD